MLYSSELGRFEQWFDCFTILFGVSSTDLMEEYENLKEMVRIETEEKEFEIVDWTIRGAREAKNWTWVKELHSSNRRIGIIINNFIWF